MVIWVTDRSGHFPQRPHYEPKELDYICEDIISSFLKNKYGSFKLPVLTDDLTILIEQDTSDLDLYADLSNEGEDVEGATDFFPHNKPAVLISENLSTQSWRENRLRTTLAHEYGHVKLHAFLFHFLQPKLLPDMNYGKGPRCRRETILNAPQKDWMEWQAGYASVALLMPKTPLKNLVENHLRERGLYNHIEKDSYEAKELIKHLGEMFNVSQDATTVRLSQLGYLKNIGPTVSLFDK